MEQLGYFGIALLMFLDNIIPPIPSEVIMPSAGYAASQGQLNLISVILAGSIGSLFAAAVLYWIGSYFKQERIFNFVDSYGKYLLIKQENVKTALIWFEKYGHWIVFFGRMIPAVRSLISIPAGMSGMPFGKFMSYSAFGTLIWTTFLALIGFYFGENQALMATIFTQIGNFVLILLAIVVLIWFLNKKKAPK